MAGEQKGRCVDTVCVGGESAGDACVGIAHDNSGVGNGGAALISDAAVDVAYPRGLARDRMASEDEKEDGNCRDEQTLTRGEDFHGYCLLKYTDGKNGV